MGRIFINIEMPDADEGGGYNYKPSLIEKVNYAICKIERGVSVSKCLRFLKKTRKLLRKCHAHEDLIDLIEDTLSQYDHLTDLDDNYY